MEIKDLSIQEKIGQMVMIGMETNQIDENIEKMITTYKIGGIILYRKNFENYDEMLDLIKNLKKLNSKNKIPLLIAIDQEGGRVNRFPKEFEKLPSANSLAINCGIEGVKESAEIIGKVLKKSGFGMDFAPVLDIKRFKNNHALGDRCYGENKEKVKMFGIAFMKELQKQGVISVIKHFPGHGATKKDSHYFLPQVKEKMIDIENNDMVPFMEAIKNGADAILVGHLRIKKVTGIYPASMSNEFINKYIRKKYNYNGLVITDDLKMRAVRFIYGSRKALRKSFEAGNDIIVSSKLCNHPKYLDKIINLVEKGKIEENRIDESVKRILEMKEKYEISDNCELEKVDINEINNRINQLREKCKE